MSDSSAVSAIIDKLREGNFDSAASMVTQVFGDAAAASPERLKQVSESVVRWQGVFGSTTEASRAEPYFRTVHTLLSELAGRDSRATLSAAENLAGILATTGNLDEAIPLREDVLRRLSRMAAADDRQLKMVRDGLAILWPGGAIA